MNNRRPLSAQEPPERQHRAHISRWTHVADQRWDFEHRDINLLQ
jgi:hypothetical protein